jgi:outer membrane protein
MKIFLVILLFFSLHAKAQRLTLEEAVNIALKNSFDIQLAKNNAEANAILNSYGVAGGLPAVSATATDLEQLSTINQKFVGGDSTRTVTASAAASNSLNLGVNANFILYNGMRIVSTKKRLQELEAQSEQLLNAQIQLTIADVMSKYYDIVRQQEYAKTIDSSIQISKLRLDILQTRMAVGLSNNADIFQAQIDLNTLIQAKQSQQLVVDIAKTELLRVLALKADSSISVNDSIGVETMLKLETVIDNLSTNPDIIAASQQIRINELIEKETAAQRYPTLSLNAGYTYGRTQNAAGQLLLNQRYGPQAGINLSIPIYNGSALKRQQRAAEINTKNAAVQKDALMNEYVNSAVKQYQTYVITLQQLEKEKENYQITQDLINLVLKRFELRVATIIELREAQQSFEETSYRLTNLKFAAKAAEIELKRLSNKLAF